MLKTKIWLLVFLLKTKLLVSVRWNVGEDTLGFQIKMSDKPDTRCGLLAALNSVYIFLVLELHSNWKVIKSYKISAGLIHPGMNQLIIILHKNGGISWWHYKIYMNVIRCIKPKNFGEFIHCSLHYFPNACQLGYMSAYTGLVIAEGVVHCSLLLGKSWVAPLKSTSIPWLELTPPTLSVKVSMMIREEIDNQINDKSFGLLSRLYLVA